MDEINDQIFRNIIISEMTDDVINNEEKDYYNKRKRIIFDGVDKHENSVTFYKAASFMVVYFAISTIYNVLYSLGNNVSLLSSPLFISSSFSLISGLVLKKIGDSYKKIARKIFRKVDEIDTFLKMKDEYNSKGVISVLEITNPDLLSKLKNCKVSFPINIITMNWLSKKDKEVAFDMASIVKNNQFDSSVEVIDLLEVQDKTIPEASKIKKMYLK